MTEKYLPIGTVCRLKGSTNLLMIIGFCVKTEFEVDEMNDYAGCPYPSGIISSDVNFVFNHEQIEEVLFRGFENDAEKNFKKQLEFQVQKMNLLNAVDLDTHISNQSQNLSYDSNNDVIESNFQQQVDVNAQTQPTFNFFNSSTNDSYVNQNNSNQ